LSWQVTENSAQCTWLYICDTDRPIPCIQQQTRLMAFLRVSWHQISWNTQHPLSPLSSSVRDCLPVISWLSIISEI